MAKTDFSLDLSHFADLSEDKMNKLARASFIGLSSDVIKGTPVRSGRARGAWLPDINGFDDSVVDIVDKSGSKAIAKVVSKSSSFKLGDTLTLSNNIPYIVRLEYGWSKQAPTGMVRLNVQRWQQIVNSKVEK